jgi:hypothetical protein
LRGSLSYINEEDGEHKGHYLSAFVVVTDAFWDDDGIMQGSTVSAEKVNCLTCGGFLWQRKARGQE